MKISKFLLLLSLVIVSVFLRFYKLSEYPVQLNHDEISQAYDTASIVKTGKDIYGNFLPLAFPSTGDYKVGHYIYLSTISYRIFGDREFMIRVASAFFGSLTPLAVFLFLYALSRNFWLAFTSGILVAVTPSEIFYSRKSFENVIGVCLVFFGLSFLFNSLNKQNTAIWKYLGVFLLVLAMYIYTSHTIVSPFLILVFVLIFEKKLIQNFKKIFYLFLFAGILVIPLIFMTLTTPGLRYRASSVFINQDINFLKQIDFSHNILKTYTDYVYNRYLTQFNPAYIFGNGLDLTNQGLIGIGPLLLIQLPLLLLGIVYIIRTSSIERDRKIFLFFLATIPMIPSSITFEQFSPHRSMFEFTLLSAISGFGLYWLFKKKEWLGYLFIAIIVLNFVYFVDIYTVSYAYEKSQQIHYPFKQVALYAWSQYNNYDSIIIDPTYGESAPVYGVATQYYLAYYGKFSTSKVQKDLKIKPYGMALDKFYIRKIDWRLDQKLTKALIIASSWEVPINQIDKSKIIKMFYFYDGQIAFYAISLK